MCSRWMPLGQNESRVVGVNTTQSALLYTWTSGELAASGPAGQGAVRMYVGEEKSLVV